MHVLRMNIHLQETTDMDETVSGKMNTDASMETSEVPLNIVGVGTLHGQRVQLVLRNDMTITDVLTTICEVSSYM